MRIGIDARYLNGQYSGIANYSENLLLHLAKLKPKHQFVVYVHPNYNKMLDSEIISRSLNIVHDQFLSIHCSLFPAESTKTTWTFCIHFFRSLPSGSRKRLW